MPRFVVLRHECPPGHPRGLHWDFMLEAGETLKTWSLPQPPGELVGQADAPLESMHVEALADHRLAYLDYEGQISGDRGVVSRFDRGEYEVVSQRDDDWVVELRGQRLRGRATLRRISDSPPHWHWQFASQG
jgi:DNA polymerase ligase (LigD)-like protein